jgi:hypothetical protein
MQAHRLSTSRHWPQHRPRASCGALKAITQLHVWASHTVGSADDVLSLVSCTFHSLFPNNPSKPTTTTQVLEALQMGLPISKSAAVSAGYEALIKNGCYLFDNKLIDSEE